jgi:SH3-like domain-containing protein
MVWRKYLRWAIFACGILFFVVATFTVTRIIVDSNWKPAVVISDSVSVMTGPGGDYVEIFELHAAAEVRIVEKRDHWVRFQLPDLREGWIEEQSLEGI